jgi:hypothetical protein
LGPEFGGRWGIEGKEWGGEEEGKKEFFHGLGFERGWGGVLFRDGEMGGRVGGFWLGGAEVFDHHVPYFESDVE